MQLMGVAYATNEFITALKSCKLPIVHSLITEANRDFLNSCSDEEKSDIFHGAFTFNSQFKFVKNVVPQFRVRN